MGLPATIPMSMLRDLQVLHIEPTDVCQAACPLCSRVTDINFDSTQQQHLSVEQLCSAVGTDTLANLNKMFACGNYGDPAAGLHTLDLFRYLRSINPTVTLGINTNGGLRNRAWWQELAHILDQSLDYAVFSIDGLADTNHVYRRGVSWNKVIENAQAFIDAGGSAHWDMLVYQHNQHQVDQARDLAKEMGFTWFRAKVSKRPLVNGLLRPTQWSLPTVGTGPVVCQALKEQSLYVDAQGKTSPCCWQGDTKIDREIDFIKIQSSWSTDTPDDICRRACTSQGKSTNFSNQWRYEVQF